MNFFERKAVSWTSWNSLWRAVPLVIGICIFTARSANERDVASRQQTNFGIITDCEYGGKGGSKFCHYNFSVGDRKYTGHDRVHHDVYFGQTKVVYYDPNNPSVSALENYAEKSRSDRNVAYWLLAAAVAITGIVLYVQVDSLGNSGGQPYRD